MKRTTTPKASRQERSIAIFQRPRLGQPGLVRIRCGKAHTDYLIKPAAADWGMAAYSLTKADGTVYHVLLHSPEQAECDCWGYTRWHHCKHADGLCALWRAGWLEGWE
ncbi:MAG TPA: hypothetical protein VNK04_01185 [Gemmataceae bacterium]|nr:hypothetical protein [Gemmataceae bacterium]